MPNTIHMMYECSYIYACMHVLDSTTQNVYVYNYVVYQIHSNIVLAIYCPDIVIFNFLKSICHYLYIAVEISLYIL